MLARYLQTINHLPSMAILSLGNALALLIYLPFTYHHIDHKVWMTPII